MSDEIVKKDGLGSALIKVSDSLANGDLEGLANGYLDLGVWAARLDHVTELAKAALKKAALAEGSSTTGASKSLQVGGMIITVKPQNNDETLEPGKLLAKLMAYKIDPSQGMDATVSWKPNPDKIKKLVDKGLLSAQDLADCRAERKWALQKPKKVDNE